MTGSERDKGINIGKCLCVRMIFPFDICFRGVYDQHVATVHAKNVTESLL